MDMHMGRDCTRAVVTTQRSSKKLFDSVFFYHTVLMFSLE